CVPDTILSLQPQPRGTVPLLFSRRGQGWFFLSTDSSSKTNVS
ncbi:MAG: hypothetical protein AVDCRST_MAG56-2305, partial [uncultured Cytophagales bacterium]